MQRDRGRRPPARSPSSPRPPSVALPTLAVAAHEHRAGSAELALACARQIADAACERFPEAPLQAALAALAREVEATPRLILRAAAGPARAAAGGARRDRRGDRLSPARSSPAPTPACRSPPSCSTGATARPPSTRPAPPPASPRRWKARWPPRACTPRRSPCPFIRPDEARQWLTNDRPEARRVRPGDGARQRRRPRSRRRPPATWRRCSTCR